MVKKKPGKANWSNSILGSKKLHSANNGNKHHQNLVSLNWTLNRNYLSTDILESNNLLKLIYRKHCLDWLRIAYIWKNNQRYASELAQFLFCSMEWKDTSPVMWLAMKTGFKFEGHRLLKKLMMHLLQVRLHSQKMRILFSRLTYILKVESKSFQQERKIFD